MKGEVGGGAGNGSGGGGDWPMARVVVKAFRSSEMVRREEDVVS